MKQANLRIAEGILSLVLSPDRVAAVVGDCLEDANQRGSFWFWGCVLRTVVAHVWANLAESPRSLAMLALHACFFNLWLNAASLLILFGPSRA